MTENVIEMTPSGKLHVATLTESVENLVYDYCAAHPERITVAEAIGCLEIVKLNLLKSLLD